MAEFKIVDCRYCRKPFRRTFSSQQFCSIECRFWSKVDIREDDECWPWLGKAKRNYGYGAFGVTQSKVVSASRFAYQLLHGEIPEGLNVLHNCDNPVCCNAKTHLYVGTQKQNVKDAMDRDRMNLNGLALGNLDRKKDFCKRGHPLSGDNLYMKPGKNRKGDPRIMRVCAECRRNEKREWARTHYTFKSDRKRRVWITEES